MPEAIFDKKTGKSIGFDKCLNLGQPKPIALNAEEQGTLRTIDAMRDEEQHWYAVVDERLLCLYTRAAVTLFDDLLHAATTSGSARTIFQAVGVSL